MINWYRFIDNVIASGHTRVYKDKIQVIRWQLHGYLAEIFMKKIKISLDEEI